MIVIGMFGYPVVLIGLAVHVTHSCPGAEENKGRADERCGRRILWLQR